MFAWTGHGLISKFPLSTLHSSLELNTRPYLIIVVIIIRILIVIVIVITLIILMKSYSPLKSFICCFYQRHLNGCDFRHRCVDLLVKYTSTTLRPDGRVGFLKFSFVKTKLESLASLDIAKQVNQDLQSICWMRSCEKLERKQDFRTIKTKSVHKFLVHMFGLNQILFCVVGGGSLCMRYICTQQVCTASVPNWKKIICFA